MTNYKGQLEERLKRASSAAAEARKDVEETIRLERQKQAIRAHIFSERQERVVKIEMAQDAMLEELQLKSEELRQRDKEKEKIEARGAKVLDDLMRMQEKAAKEKSGLEARWAKVHEEYSELRERQTGVVKAKVKAEQEAAKAIAEAQAAKKMAKANSAKAITAAKEASEAKAWAIAQAEAAAEIARKQQEKMVGFQARQAKVLEKLEAKGKKNDAAAELERKQAEEAFEKERAEFIRRQEEETDKIVKSKAKEQAELLQKKEEAAAKLMKSTEKLVKSMEKEKVELLRKKEELKAKLVQSTKKETAELFREKEEKKEMAMAMLEAKLAQEQRALRTKMGSLMTGAAVIEAKARRERAAAAKEKAALQSVVDQLEGQVAMLASGQAAAESKISLLHTQAEALLDSSAAELEVVRTQKEAEVERVKAQMASLNTALASAFSNVGSLQGQFETTLADETAQASHANETTIYYTEMVRMLESDLLATKQSVFDQNATIVEVNILLEDARQSVATLTTLQEEDAELKSLFEADLVRLEKQHQQKRKEDVEFMKALEVKLAVLEDQRMEEVVLKKELEDDLAVLEDERMSVGKTSKLLIKAAVRKIFKTTKGNIATARKLGKKKASNVPGILLPGHPDILRQHPNILARRATERPAWTRPSAWWVWRFLTAMYLVK
mmetsp:Transcript_63408/g.174466  ORF Transcript_63408/g.174466 Transcript_63408/m.174466 type:complete len:671 (+) Transcript_63408:2019-4031(+)